jgi:hypothetical protein
MCTDYIVNSKLQYATARVLPGSRLHVTAHYQTLLTFCKINWCLDFIKLLNQLTGSGFLRGTTSPANMVIFSSLSGNNKHATIAETCNQYKQFTDAQLINP